MEKSGNGHSHCILSKFSSSSAENLNYIVYNEPSGTINMVLGPNDILADPSPIKQGKSNEKTETKTGCHVF